MKTLQMLVGAWLVFVLFVVAIAIAGSPSASNPGPRPRHQMVSGLGQLDMLEADQQMLQQMRPSSTRREPTGSHPQPPISAVMCGS